MIIGLIVIWAIFQIQEDRFLTATNLTNLVLQITGVALISVGVVLVLLLGEIDLSVGAVSGLCAAVMAVLNVKHGWSPYTAIAAGVLAGTAIGLFQGFIFTRFGVPSFVVTLAGLLAWQGGLLEVLGETGTINITDEKIVGLTGTFYSDAVGWTLAIIAIAAFALIGFMGRQRRVKGRPACRAALAARGADGDPRGRGDRGRRRVQRGPRRPAGGADPRRLRARVPVPDHAHPLRRHIYAVGGNAEAARRAGIHVTRLRVVVFMLCSTMAAVGGIMLASRLLAVNQSSGAGDLLLLAIAGPVIAGTSLFGGRGTVWTALLGALVIGSISNGMDLLALSRRSSSWSPAQCCWRP